MKILKKNFNIIEPDEIHLGIRSENTMKGTIVNKQNVNESFQYVSIIKTLQGGLFK